MKRVLIDINVIMDLAFKRAAFKSAAKIMDMCVKDEIKGYLCAHEITTLAYLLEKNFNRQRVNFFLQEILDIFEIIPGTDKILLAALDSEIKDYEDAVIEVSALEAEIDYIITVNLKDFKVSQVKAISPEGFILLSN